MLAHHPARRIAAASMCIQCLLVLLSVTAHAGDQALSAIKGDIGELTMDAFFASEGWESINAKHTGNHGLDGLFAKRSPTGQITDIMIVEAKSEGSQLNRLVTGEMQLSKAYNQKQIERALAETERMITAHEGDIAVQQVRQRDLLSAKRFVEADIAKCRLFRHTFANGEQTMSIYKAVSTVATEAEVAAIPTMLKTTPTAEAAIARLATESERAFANRCNDVLVNTFSKSVPGWRPALHKGLTSGALKTYPSIVNELAGTKFAAQAPRLMRGAVMQPATGESLEVAMERVATQQAVKIGARVLPRTSGLLLKNGSILLSKVGNAAGSPYGMGVVSFAIDGTVAYNAYEAGEITETDFHMRLVDAGVKATVVTAAVVVAVVLGATPGGIVVLAVGAGAYFAADYCVGVYREHEARKFLTSEELDLVGIIRLPLTSKPGLPWEQLTKFADPWDSVAAAKR